MREELPIKERREANLSNRRFWSRQPGEDGSHTFGGWDGRVERHGVEGEGGKGFGEVVCVEGVVDGGYEVGKVG